MIAYIYYTNLLSIDLALEIPSKVIGLFYRKMTSTTDQILLILAGQDSGRIQVILTEYLFDVQQLFHLTTLVPSLSST